MSTLKKVFLSKSIWGNIGTGLLIGAQFIPVASQVVGMSTPLGAGLALATVGLSAYGRIRAKQPLGPVVDDTIKKTMEIVHQINQQTPPNPSQVATVTTLVKTTK